MNDESLTVFGIATPDAWDVVESAQRHGLTVRCVDNYGGADARLPGLVPLGETAGSSTGWVSGCNSRFG